MNKAVLALCLVLIAAAVAGGVWYYYNEMGGEFSIGQAPKEKAQEPKPPREFVKPNPSPIVSHETMATPTTTARAVIQPRRIAALIDKLVPWDQVQKLQINEGVKKMLKDDLDEVLPNEIAVLGGPNYQTNQFEITFFLNQQYYDILVPMAGGQILPRVPFITWAKEGLKLRQPGAVAASGTLPLPEGLDATLQQYWASLEPPADALKAEGGHLLEIALDNRNAAVLALVGAGAALNGMAVEQMFSMPGMDQVPKVVSQLSSLRVQADLDPNGALVVDIALRKLDSAGAEVDMPISFIVNSFVLPEIEARLAEQGLEMQGEVKWEGPVFHAHYTVPGAEAKVLELIQGLLAGNGRGNSRPQAPGTAAPETPATPQS